jgi:hypothetical protein
VKNKKKKKREGERTEGRKRVKEERVKEGRGGGEEERGPEEGRGGEGREGGRWDEEDGMRRGTIFKLGLGNEVRRVISIGRNEGRKEGGGRKKGRKEGRWRKEGEGRKVNYKGVREGGRKERRTDSWSRRSQTHRILLFHPVPTDVFHGLGHFCLPGSPGTGDDIGMGGCMSCIVVGYNDNSSGGVCHVVGNGEGWERERDRARERRDGGGERGEAMGSRINPVEMKMKISCFSSWFVPILSFCSVVPRNSVQTLLANEIRQIIGSSYFPGSHCASSASLLSKLTCFG